MERNMILDSLRTLVERLIELSPKLNRPEFSVLKGQGVPINQWQGKLEIFIKAIDGTVSDCDEWLANVKALAADVEKILNEIAGTKMFEEPSKRRFQPLKRIKGKAVPTVNADLRAKIGRAGDQMATLDESRSEIGLPVYDVELPMSADDF